MYIILKLQPNGKTITPPQGIATQHVISDEYSARYWSLITLIGESNHLLVAGISCRVLFQCSNFKFHDAFKFTKINTFRALFMLNSLYLILLMATCYFYILHKFIAHI